MAEESKEVQAWKDGLRERVASTFEDIRLAFEALLRDWPNTKDQPFALYHFTDSTGLVGILRDRTLWASLGTALNDASETRYALEMLSADVRSGQITLKSLRPEKVQEFCHKSPLTGAMRAFVCSFCGTVGAAHWLHYGRSGAGVALGFEATQLASLGEFQLHQVLYSPPEQRSLIRAVIDLVDERASEFTEHKITHDAFARLATDYLRLVAPRIKSPAFKSEDEWRLFSIQRMATAEERERLGTAHDTHFRTANDRVIPYMKVAFPSSALRHIELGASNPMAEDEQALRVLVEEFSETQVNVTRSTIQVRR